jgi:hypothetical protein
MKEEEILNMLDEIIKWSKETKEGLEHWKVRAIRAETILGMLPPDQGVELRKLHGWPLFTIGEGSNNGIISLPKNLLLNSDAWGSLESFCSSVSFCKIDRSTTSLTSLRIYHLIENLIYQSKAMFIKEETNNG